MKNIIEKYKNMSFSEAAEAIGKKWKNKDTDLIEKNSYNQELEELAKYQEKKRVVSQMTDAVKQFKKGGTLPQYPLGGPMYDGIKLAYDLTNQPLVPPADNLFGSTNLSNALSTNTVNSTIPNVPNGNNAWEGLPEFPPNQVTKTNYGTRPETILSYAKTNMTPGMAIKPYDDTPYKEEDMWDKFKRVALDGDNWKVFNKESNFGLNSLLPNKQNSFTDVNGKPTTINNSLGMSTPKDKPKTREEMSAYAPALIGQGVSTALNLGILAGGYDKVSPVNNPYESQVIRNMASRGIDTTQQRNQILSAYNAAKEGLNNVRSTNVRNTLNTNLMNVTQDNLAESKLQEQGMNNQYKGDFANVLNNLGQQKVQSQTYAEDMTARNKSTFENNLSYFGDLMAQHGESFSAFKANQNMNTALGQILNDKYATTGLGISQETIDKFNSGKATKEDWTELTAKIKKANPNLAIPEFKLQ